MISYQIFFPFSSPNCATSSPPPLPAARLPPTPPPSRPAPPGRPSARPPADGHGDVLSRRAVALTRLLQSNTYLVLFVLFAESVAPAGGDRAAESNTRPEDTGFKSSCHVTASAHQTAAAQEQTSSTTPPCRRSEPAQNLLALLAPRASCWIPTEPPTQLVVSDITGTRWRVCVFRVSEI